jgi:hypothetical protein
MDPPPTGAYALDNPDEGILRAEVILIERMPLKIARHSQRLTTRALKVSL